MRKFSALLMVLAMLLTLVACSAPTEPNNTVTVSTVDEFLAALAPNRTIQLEPGHYDLSTASGYGKLSENPYCTWRTNYDSGYELNLQNLRDLTIVGSGMGQTFLEADPNNEAVLKLINCENVTFRSLSVGFSKAASSWCCNYAIYAESCNGIKLEETELFGCMEAGIYATNNQNLTITDSQIGNCDNGAATLYNSRNVNIRGSKFCNIGSEGMTYSIIDTSGCTDVVVDNCEIYNCNADLLVNTFGRDASIRFKDTLFRDNKVLRTVFAPDEGTIVVDNCKFENNEVEAWISRDYEGRVEDAEGNVMLNGDFREPANVSPEEDTPWQEITVSNIDEFLAALGSNREIRLAPGTYNLQDASNYGQQSDSRYYEWEVAYDGYTLVLKDLRDLTIVGSGTEQTLIETLPRSAAVLSLSYCGNIAIRDMTIGHVETADYCEGPVIDLRYSSRIVLEGLGLYGCGTTGVEAWDSERVTINNCHIYDCSVFGVYLANCDSVSITNCAIDRIGGINGSGMNVLNVDNCSDVIMDNCTVSDCVVEYLITSWSEPDSLTLKNTAFRNNYVVDCGFNLDVYTKITLDNCTFGGNTVMRWYNGEVGAVDTNGTPITGDDLDKLNVSYVETPTEEDAPWQEITVSNIDEFLAALGPNRTIQLAPGTYNLCDASSYGKQTGSLYYIWEDTYDGYELQLNGMPNLTIIGCGADQTVIETLPRSAAVLQIKNCRDLTIQSLTMGHVEMADYCEGPVLWLRSCGNVNLEGLGLYGCGTEGVYAVRCGDLVINNCHIYDCSTGGVSLDDCDNVSITNSTFDRLGKEDSSALDVLDSCWSGTVVMDNCTVSDSNVESLINSYECVGDVTIRNTAFRNNRVEDVAFAMSFSENIILDTCTFGGNTVAMWYSMEELGKVVDAGGTPITIADLEAMNG